MSEYYKWVKVSHTGPRKYVLQKNVEEPYGPIAYNCGVLSEQTANVWEVLGTPVLGQWQLVATLELPLREAKQAAKLILIAKG